MELNSKCAGLIDVKHVSEDHAAVSSAPVFLSGCELIVHEIHRPYIVWAEA